MPVSESIILILIHSKTIQRLALSFRNILKDELYIQYEEVAIHGKRTNFRQAQKS